MRQLILFMILAVTGCKLNSQAQSVTKTNPGEGPKAKGRKNGRVTPKMLENRDLITPQICKALAGGDTDACADIKDSQSKRVCQALAAGKAEWCPKPAESEDFRICWAMAAYRKEHCRDDNICAALASEDVYQCPDNSNKNNVCKALAGHNSEWCPEGDRICMALADSKPELCTQN